MQIEQDAHAELTRLLMQRYYQQFCFLTDDNPRPTTVESGYQAHIRYLAHTAYQAHAVFLTKSVQTLDKKRTALIRRKFGVGEANYKQSKHAKVVQTRNNFAGKCGRDMKRTKNIRHGTASYRIHLASPLIRHPQRVHRLRVTLTHELRFL